MARNLALVAQVADLYRSGKSMKEVGRIVGMSPSGVAKLMADEGIPARSRGRPKPAIDMRKVRALYQQGMGMETIGRLLGVSRWTIRTRMVQEGIPRRPPGQRPAGHRYAEADIIAMYIRGVPLSEIRVRNSGISASTIYSILDEAGIARRQNHAPRERGPAEQ